MFIFKQSSMSFGGNFVDRDGFEPPWTHFCPISTASRMPNHGSTGTGGCNFLQYKIMSIGRDLLIMRAYYLKSSTTTRRFGIANAQKLIICLICPIGQRSRSLQPTNICNKYNWIFDICTTI